MIQMIPEIFFLLKVKKTNLLIIMIRTYKDSLAGFVKSFFIGLMWPRPLRTKTTVCGPSIRSPVHVDNGPIFWSQTVHLMDRFGQRTTIIILRWTSGRIFDHGPFTSVRGGLMCNTLSNSVRQNVYVQFKLHII